MQLCGVMLFVGVIVLLRLSSIDHAIALTTPPSSSSSSSSSSSRGPSSSHKSQPNKPWSTTQPGTTTKKKTVSGGSTNTSSRKRSRNEEWYERRKQQQQQTTPTAPRRRMGPKPPQWEKEGDQLYMKLSKTKMPGQSDHGELAHLPVIPKTIEEAHNILQPYLADALAKQIENDDNIIQSDEQPEEKPFLWGGLSVGPIWKSRLVSAGYILPTPIQKESFQVLASGNENAVIAAPTGSGKSLAYLLPFLTKGTKAMGQIWVVCPTMELAFQLQSVVDRLYKSSSNSNINSNSRNSQNGSDDNDTTLQHQSCFHVLEYSTAAGDDASIDYDDGEARSPTYPLLKRLQNQCNDKNEPFFLAATPKIFRQLQREIDRILGTHRPTRLNSNIIINNQPVQSRKGSNDDVHALARTINNNLATVIFDEADRLFQTEKTIAYIESKRDPSLERKAIAATSPPPLSVALLETCMYRSNKFTQGRYRSPPPNQNLQVVAVSATVGRSLRRQLMRTLQTPNIDATARLVTLENRSTKNADTRRAALLPASLKHSYRLFDSSIYESNERTNKDDKQSTVLDEIVGTIKSLEPSPLLIFPGRIGLEAVQSYLRLVGFKDIRGLKTTQSIDIGNNHPDISTTITKDWATTPVYVVKERLSRGLDLPDVRTVLLVGVPSNPSGYIHLAGRTARNNSRGEVITLCQPEDALKLAMIAESLGVRFEQS